MRKSVIYGDANIKNSGKRVVAAAEHWGVYRFGGNASGWMRVKPRLLQPYESLAKEEPLTVRKRVPWSFMATSSE